MLELLLSVFFCFWFTYVIRGGFFLELVLFVLVVAFATSAPDLGQTLLQVCLLFGSPLRFLSQFFFGWLLLELVLGGLFSLGDFSFSRWVGF